VFTQDLRNRSQEIWAPQRETKQVEAQPYLSGDMENLDTEPRIAERPNPLAGFFKEPETSMGVFYPTHYIIATFPSFEVAKQAKLALRSNGFSEDEVLPVSSAEALDFFRQFQDHAGIWGHLMTELSRFIDTEATKADKDIERAKHGAGFLVVHSPTEKESKRVQEIVAPLSPIAMHWYLPGGIQSLV
jgi:hypothetical protein